MYYYLYVIKEDELPTIEMGSDSYVHILYSCPFKPASRLLQGFNSPDTSSSIETKEIKEYPINLLFHLKVETQINVLETSQQVLVLVHKNPSSLNKS